MHNKEDLKPHEMVKAKSHVPSMEDYRELYQHSINDPVDFWYSMGQRFHWQKNPTKEKVMNCNLNPEKGPVSIKWYEDGVTNLCYNCLDRHIERNLGDKIAFEWVGNEAHERCSITFSQLREHVMQLAICLKSQGVKKGSSVAIYMPMILQLPIALLACARIGAIHSVVFGGFSAHALADRLVDAQCETLLTCDLTKRGPKLLELKKIADQAMQLASEKHQFTIKNCIVVQRFPDANANIPQAQMQPGRDHWYHEAVSKISLNGVSPKDTIEWVNAEDQLFILYTSGSTGKPKGIVHTTAGYMVYAGVTTYYTFDLQPEDRFFCTADIGWITGHSYVVYGPLLNAVTSVVFEGLPVYPEPERFWQIIEDLSITKFYTAPTAIRTLIKYGDEPVKKHCRATLQVLGTVGEPIDATSWHWYYDLVGEKKCSIVDTFWQTETGGHMITCLPGCTPMRPGSAGFPFFGVKAQLLVDDAWKDYHHCEEDDDQLDLREIRSGHLKEGCLVFSQAWPGMARTVWKDHGRFESTYFKRFPGHYMTGDGARMDEDGYFWITGRIDDMFNVSGHLLSTAQVEGAMLKHGQVAECAVVPKPHPEKGQCMHVFVVMKDGQKFTDEVRKQLVLIVREDIGPIATPDVIDVLSELPKTRSGKVMRRILAKVVHGQTELGDLSTLSNVAVIDELKRVLNLTDGKTVA